jgi:RNA polymerase sigma-70 factor (ECF subfamily)
VSVRPEADSDVVVLVGELDFATAPELTSTIDELVLTGHHRIVVDLDAVTFVDTAAIDAVITATCAVALAGGTLRLTHHPRLMALLEHTRETHRVEVARALQSDRVEPRAPEARSLDDADLPSLLSQSARGDEVAFAAVYDVTGARAYGLALRLLRQPAVAAEAVREGYLYLWRHAAGYRPIEGSAVSWILRTVHQCAVRRARSMPAGVAAHDSSIQTSRSPASRAMLDLPSSQREAVEMAYFEGRTHSQVEQSRGLPVGIAQLRIRDGLLALRDRMGDR